MWSDREGIYGQTTAARSVCDLLGAGILQSVVGLACCPDVYYVGGFFFFGGGGGCCCFVFFKTNLYYFLKIT